MDISQSGKKLEAATYNKKYGNFEVTDKYNKARSKMYLHKSEKNYYLNIAEIGNTGKFYFDVSRHKKEILSKDFSSFDKAMAGAIKYMKSITAGGH